MIVDVFLNGPESPTIETAKADFSVLGVRMRGCHKFGVDLQDPSAPPVERLAFAWKRRDIHLRFVTRSGHH